MYTMGVGRVASGLQRYISLGACRRRTLCVPDRTRHKSIMSAAELPPFEHATGMKFTEVPNPGWTFGQKLDATPEGRAWLDGEKEGWKVVDTSREDPRYVLRDRCI